MSFTSIEPTPDALPAGLTARARTVALLVILLGFFMDVLDSTIVNVAIPSIQDSLGASYAAIQWIVAGYSLAFALFLITGGRLGDIYGYKRVFLVGIAGFTAASVLSGMATTTEMLVAARLLQGVMAAIMVPQVLSSIQVMYPTVRERRKVAIYYGSIAGVATVVGPILGAILIDSDVWELGWRTIFLVNLPVGVAAMALAAVYLPDSRSPHPLRLDIPGVALVLVAMLMLMYPLIEGRQLDWPAWVFVSMALSVPVFVLFFRSQVWKERRDGSPLVVPQLFRRRSFVAGILLLSSFYAIVYGFFLVFILFLQIGLDYPILKAGLTGIPFSIGVIAAAATASPILVPRYGRAIVTVGPVVMAAGFFLLIATARHFGGAVTPWELLPALVIAGVGMGFVAAPIYPFALAEVPVADAGSASGVVNTVAQIGGAIGVAVVGAIYFGAIAGQAATSVGSVRPNVEAGLSAAKLAAPARQAIVASFEACFTDGAAAKDSTTRPDSCRLIRKQVANVGPDEQVNAVAEVLQQYGREATQRNFTRAVEHTLFCEIAALALVFLITFLLPPRPRAQDELGMAGMGV